VVISLKTARPVQTDSAVHGNKNKTER
jgi:hypothetical protein